jgi:hypothetical protein
MVMLLLIIAMAVMTSVPFFTACRDRYRMPETQGPVTPALSRGNRARTAHAGHAPPSSFNPPYYCLPILRICRNLVFRTVSAALLQPLFSQFSKS